MNKRLTLQANGNTYFNGYKCEHCGSAMVIASSSKSPHCAFCSEALSKGTPVSRAELTASPEKELSYVKCLSCDTVFAAESDESAEELAASKYCVDCAGDSLVACDNEGTPVEMDGGAEACEGSGDDSEDKDEKDDSDNKDDLESGLLADGDEYSELDASTADDLQWNALDTNNGEMTAMMASSVKTGNPIALFRKENAPSSLQPLFAQSVFVSAFNEVAHNDGLALAIKAFGGNYCSAKVLTAADIEKAALANMQGSALPRLIDCCQMAVEGGVKGIYPDVYTSMQRSLVNELVASGIDSERANRAVGNTFAIHGSDLFGTIIAKAMDLYTKPETARMEAKSLIMQASSPAMAAINTQQAEIRAAMEKPTVDFGVLNMTAGAIASPITSRSDVTSMRRELF